MRGPRGRRRATRRDAGVAAREFEYRQVRRAARVRVAGEEGDRPVVAYEHVVERPEHRPQMRGEPRPVRGGPDALRQVDGRLARGAREPHLQQVAGFELQRLDRGACAQVAAAHADDQVDAAKQMAERAERRIERDRQRRRTCLHDAGRAARREHRSRMDVGQMRKRCRIGGDHGDPHVRAERVAQQADRQVDEQAVAGIARAVCVQQRDMNGGAHRGTSSRRSR